MNWPLFIPLVTTVVIAIVGWFAAHRLAASRDQINKRREMRLNLLLGAYRALESATNRDFGGEVAQAACKAFADIQLVGTPNQVKLAQKLMLEFAQNQGGDWQPLLLSLREDLRSELGLNTLENNLVHLRWADPTEEWGGTSKPGAASVNKLTSPPNKNSSELRT